MTLSNNMISAKAPPTCHSKSHDIQQLMPPEFTKSD